jgi:DNA-binding transcriptional LysR family regulator
MAGPDLDVHLLRCLDALVEERHVTRAGERMGMSQSGMSAVLARLRTAFDDPLLVRTPMGMELSENALEIAGAVRRALNELEIAVSRRGKFDPQTSSLTFSMMASDYVGTMLLPALIARMRQEAPGLSLRIVAPQPARIREVLANNEADIVVGFFIDVSEGLYQNVVLTDTLSCVVSADHPTIQGHVTAEDYAAGGHMYFGSTPGLVSPTEALLEQILPRQDIERRIHAEIPTLSVIPRIVARTDLIATIPTKFARSFAERLPLQVLALPFEAPELPIRAIWHERMHDNNAHRWLRTLLRSVASEI